MQKIKIATIITQLELGGAQQIALFTANSLDNNLYESYFITGEKGLLDEYARLLPNIKIYSIKNLQRLVRPVKDFFALLQLIKLLRQLRPDIVHTHSSKAGILGRWAAFFARVPVVIHTYHGFGFNDFQRLPVKMLYVLIERFTAYITTFFIAVSSENIKKALDNRIGKIEKFKVIHCGIDVEKFSNTNININEKKQQLGIPNNSKVVGNVACFKPQKAPLDFVRTAKKIYDKNKDVFFVMVGDGVLRPEIESEIQKLGLKNNFILTGFRDDVNELMKIFDVFFLPSKWEGLPMVVLQAMAADLPIVATAIDGTKEIIEDNKNGFLTKVGDIENMSVKILYLLDDENENEKNKFIIKNKELLKGDFNIKNMAKIIEKLYKELLLK